MEKFEIPKKTSETLSNEETVPKDLEQIIIERIKAIAEKWPERISIRDLAKLISQTELEESLESPRGSKGVLVRIRDKLADIPVIGKPAQYLRAKTFAYRFTKAIEGLQKEAQDYNQELKIRHQLKEWLRTLPSNITFKLNYGNGDYEMNSWILEAVDSNGETVSTFSLDHNFYILESDEGLPVISQEAILGDELKRIPEEIRNQWRAKRDKLRILGFETATEVSEMLEKFQRIEIETPKLEQAFSNPAVRSKLPPEIEYLFGLGEKNPEVLTLLSKLIEILKKDKSRKLIIKRLKEPPENLIEGIRKFSVETQHGLTQWLAPLITKGELPQINRADYARREATLKASGEIWDDPSLKEGYKFSQQEIEIAKQVSLELVLKENNWEGTIQQLQEFHKFFVALEIHEGEPLSPEELEILESINALIDREISPEVANMMINLHDMREISKEAMVMLKLLPFIGLSVHELEKFDLGVIAKFLASQSGDTLAEGAELSAYIKQYGFEGFGDFLTALINKNNPNHKRALNIINRLGITGPALVISAGLSAMSHYVIEKYGPLIGGPFFAISAVLGTLTTQVVTIKLFASAYEGLFAEGKLPGMRPSNISPEEWESFIELVGGWENIQRIIANHNSSAEAIINCIKEVITRFFEDPINIFEFFTFTFRKPKQAGLVLRYLPEISVEKINAVKLSKFIVDRLYEEGFSPGVDLRREVLKRFGKLDNLREEDRRLLNEALGVELTSEQYDKFVSAIQETIADLVEIINHIQSYLENLDNETRNKIFNPSVIAKWQSAFDEAVWRNPARRSIALAIMATLIVSPFGAMLALKIPALWAVFGDLEALLAGGLAYLLSSSKKIEQALRNLLRGKLQSYRTE